MSEWWFNVVSAQPWEKRADVLTRGLAFTEQPGTDLSDGGSRGPTFGQGSSSRALKLRATDSASDFTQ